MDDLEGRGIPLADFVKEALVGIVKGVAQAQPEVAESGGSLNPANIEAMPAGISSSAESGRIILNVGKKSVPVSMVQFNIHVTAEASTNAGKGGGLSVKAMGIGAEVSGRKGDSGRETSAHRLSFEVPLALPVGEALNVQR